MSVWERAEVQKVLWEVRIGSGGRQGRGAGERRCRGEKAEAEAWVVCGVWWVVGGESGARPPGCC